MIGNGGISNPEKPFVLGSIQKWGEQIDIDTADTSGALTQKIWPIKRTIQDYIFLDAAIELFIVSTDITDTILGVGAQKVKITYHDSLGIEQEITKDLDGQNNVSIGDSFGVFRMEIDQTGTSNTNVGQIKIVDGSANIYATIEIGEGQTQIAVQRIPNNRSAIVTQHKTDYARTGPSNDAQMRLRVRKTDGTIVTKWDPTLTTLNTEDVKIYAKDAGIKMLPGEWIFWECIEVSASNTPIRGSFDIDLKAAV